MINFTIGKQNDKKQDLKKVYLGVLDPIIPDQDARRAHAKVPPVRNLHLRAKVAADCTAAYLPALKHLRAERE